MPLFFNCLATGIGSLPHSDPAQAVALSLNYLPEAPTWPQLPQRSFLEQFCVQYIVKDLEHFRISNDYAAGLCAFIAELRKNGPPSRARFLKGHCTGPLTFGITIKDHRGKTSSTTRSFFDAVTKGLAMKAAWQVRVLKQFSLPVMLFIDDPAMYALTSGLYPVAPDASADKLREIILMVRDEGGTTGIHCCGNADRPLLFRTGVDIVSFDAAGYLERVLLYPDVRYFSRELQDRLCLFRHQASQATGGRDDEPGLMQQTAALPLCICGKYFPIFPL